MCEQLHTGRCMAHGRVTPRPPSHAASQMQKFISGHLNLLRALVTCEGVNKHKCGAKLVNQVLDYFLFPASNLMAEGVEPLERGEVEISPRCEEVESQVSAYKLLTVLAVGSVENISILSRRLVQLHLTEKPEMAKEWEVGSQPLDTSVIVSIPLCAGRVVVV